jgi:hypothetical protein
MFLLAQTSVFDYKALHAMLPSFTGWLHYIADLLCKLC